jgi:hypothetical protein
MANDYLSVLTPKELIDILKKRVKKDWDAVIGAEGYRVVVAYDDASSIYENYYFDVATNSADYFIGVTLVGPATPIVTPSSGYEKVAEFTGGVSATEFYGKHKTRMTLVA